MYVVFKHIDTWQSQVQAKSSKDRNGVKNFDTLVPQWMGFVDVPSRKRSLCLMFTHLRKEKWLINPKAWWFPRFPID